MLDPRVDTFLAVCENLNYTKAASELNLTQSAVSQHMAYLERYYGVKLIAMQGKKMKLTPQGLLLQRTFQSLSHDEKLLKSNIALQRQRALRSFRLGATLTAGEYIIAPALAHFMASHKDVHIDIVSRCTAELLSLLQQGLIDAAFIEGIFDRALYKSEVLCQQQLIGVCSPNSPYAKGSYGLEDILCSTLIVRESESGSRAVLEHALLERNLSLDSFAVLTQASSINIIKTLVTQNVGISFVYESAVKEEIFHGKLCQIDLIEFDVSHDISFVCLSSGAFEDELFELYKGIAHEYQKSV